MSGAVLRIRTDYIPLHPMTPFDSNNDETKNGTAFLLRLHNHTFILTAHHVVSNGRHITATSQQFMNGEAFECIVAGQNPHLDIAILSPRDNIDQSMYPAFDIGRSSLLKPKDTVSIVGYAGATIRTHTTTGTISGLCDYPHHRFQTDCAVNGGQSGSPCLDSDGKVVGVCTSGMDDMQNTNFFTGIDEAILVIQRCYYRYISEYQVAIDHGFHLNAILSPVDEAACSGEVGGMRVMKTLPNIGLIEGDIIVKVQESSGCMLDVNSFGKVVTSFYKYDSVDIRTLLDHMFCENETLPWTMEVRRRGRYLLIQAKCGPPCLPHREIFPDCEHWSYISYGGCIFQMLNWNIAHEMGEEIVDIETYMNSYVICTHVFAGSPYSRHDAHSIVGKKLVSVLRKDQSPTEIKTLQQLHSYIREEHPEILMFSSGECVGASREAVDKFHKSLEGPHTNGWHEIGRGVLREPRSRPCPALDNEAYVLESDILY